MCSGLNGEGHGRRSLVGAVVVFENLLALAEMGELIEMYPVVFIGRHQKLNICERSWFLDEEVLVLTLHI